MPRLQSISYSCKIILQLILQLIDLILQLWDYAQNANYYNNEELLQFRENCLTGIEQI